MRNLVVSSVVMALLVFSGCSSKDQKVTEDVAPVEEVVQQKPVEVAPVSTDLSSRTVEDNTESASEYMARIEKELSSIYFDFDKFFIRNDMKANVSADVQIVNSSAKAFTVKLEGNCDEWGSDEYNFALGLKRANEVKKALTAEGVSESRITMVSFGESNPSCTEKTKDCWAQNRRVDFKLLP